MANGHRGVVLGQMNRLFGPGTVAGMPEAELLERFVHRRDEVAFRALVDRHGPMVLGVCRRVLGNPHDADDAFQATFLVLARRAGAIRNRAILGHWLHAVAHRVAVRARSEAGRRPSHEAPDLAADSPAPPWIVEQAESHSVLHEEVARLPEKYRAPVVLCHLEGHTHDEAANLLSWPVGTVRGRLSRARDLLRTRLVKRGLGATAGLLVAALRPEPATAAESTNLFESTVQAAMRVAASKTAMAGLVSASVAPLAEGVLFTMFVAKMKTAASIAALVALFAVTGAIAAFPPSKQTKTEPKAGQADEPKAKVSGNSDLDKLQGTWRQVSAEHAKGKAASKAAEDQTRLVVRGDRFTFYPKVDGIPIMPVVNSMKLDPSKTPKAIDLVETNTSSPRSSLGIYELDGNKLTVCLRPLNFVVDPGNDSLDAKRPREFQAVPTATFQEGSYLYEYERIDEVPPKADEVVNDELRWKELEGLQGDWHRTEATLNGRPLSAARFGDTYERININRSYIYFYVETKGPSGMVQSRVKNMLATLDPTTKPGSIDLYPLETEGERRVRGKAIRGIYQRKNNDLRICLAVNPDAPRPTTFQSMAGSGLLSDRYRRKLNINETVPTEDLFGAADEGQTEPTTRPDLPAPIQPAGTKLDDQERIRKSDDIQARIDLLESTLQDDREELRATTAMVKKLRHVDPAEGIPETDLEGREKAAAKAEERRRGYQMQAQELEDHFLIKNRDLRKLRREAAELGLPDSGGALSGPPGSTDLERRLTNVERKLDRILQSLENPPTGRKR